MLQGFVAVGAIVGLGALLAHYKVVDATEGEFLARLSFVVAGPALMVVMLSTTDLGVVFSTALVATAAGVAVSLALYLVVARLAFRASSSSLVVGALAATFVNSGSLGIPVAAYVLDDAGAVLPMLLVQLVVLQPAAIMLVETRGRPSAGQPRAGRAIVRPLAHPLLLGTAIGLTLAATGVVLPDGLDDAALLVGGMAVPAMLLSYGAALVHGPPIRRGTPVADLVLILVVKLVVHPLVTYAVGRFLLDLEGSALLGITVIAALPSAQNVFLLAHHYGRGVVLARDAILATTALAVPVLLTIGWLLRPES